MISKYLKPGDRLEIETITKGVSNGNDETKKTYRSEIYEIMSEDQIQIAMPMEQMKVILLPVDGEFSLCFYTNSGLYQCIGRVAERYKSNNLFVLVMELVTGLQRYQRREYYRLNCVLDMKSKMIDEKELENSHEQLIFMDTDLTFDNGVMVDISGGGARFISKVEYPNGSLIRFNFSLFVNGALNEYKLIGKVLKSRELENKPHNYEHRVMFVNIMNDDRESIIRYIFEEERKIRHRERG